jgi:hypothetical protein
MANGTDENPLEDGLKYASEYMVPGGSHLVNGDIVRAGIHFTLGVVAKYMFGFPGLLLVKANSIAKAKTGRSLVESLGQAMSQGGGPTTPPRSKT